MHGKDAHPKIQTRSTLGHFVFFPGGGHLGQVCEILLTDLLGLITGSGFVEEPGAFNVMSFMASIVVQQLYYSLQV